MLAACPITSRPIAFAAHSPLPVSHGRRRRCLAPWAPPPRPRAWRARAAAKANSDASQQVQQQISLELPTADVQSAVRLAGLRQGRGVAIVVASVEPGSAAAAAGVRTGQQLLRVSDPVRREEHWELNAQASLRYVRQAIAMRVAETITLTLSAEPLPEWRRAVEAARAAERAAADALTQQADAVAEQQQQQEQQQEQPGDLLSNIVRASMDAGSSFDEAGSGGNGGDAPGALTPAGAELQRRLTVAEKLEAEYQRQQASGGSMDGGPTPRQLTDLERRQKRRKEYFEQQSTRNDAPFFAAVLLLFALPPAVILGAAFASGYLDQLDIYGLLR